ncbi:MAG: carboxypeptidase-like regulatory domain-containing protein [Bacteroidota bacterium]
MRRLPLFFLLVLPLLFTAAYAQPLPTATLEGRVVDRDRQPIPGASVFLAQTQRGTITDRDGRYQLTRVPLGAHRLVASSAGFETGTEDLVLRREGETKTVNFRLRGLELGEVVVEADRDEKWQRQYERFERRFLGETANAEQTEILNPFVVDFEERLGMLKASAREPLVIENRALGYRIRYSLTAFEAEPNRNFFTGEPLFEEMEPEDGIQRAQWEANRRKAYLGSPRHLLRSLVASVATEQTGDTHRADEEGFSLFIIPNQGMGGGSPFGNPMGGRRGGAERMEIAPTDVVEATRREGEYKLSYVGIMEVVYRNEPEAPGFLEREWARERRDLRAVQTSQFRFPIAQDRALLDRFGRELDPRSITLSGYMAYERFAEDLPREYGLAESGLPGAEEAARLYAEQRLEGRPETSAPSPGTPSPGAPPAPTAEIDAAEEEVDEGSPDEAGRESASKKDSADTEKAERGKGDTRP